MSSRFHQITRAAALSAMLALSSQALSSRAMAQSDDADPEMRIRQLAGQNEELQYRNRQLEERLRQLQGGAQAAPGQVPGVVQPSVAAAPPVQPNPAYRQPGYDQQQIAAPAPIMQEPQGVPPAQGRRRGDAFDPNQNPSAPRAPRALGGRQLPLPAETQAGAPAGRGAGEPLGLATTC